MTPHTQTDATYQIVILVYKTAKRLHHDTDGFADPVILKSSGMLSVPVPFVVAELTKYCLCVVLLLHSLEKQIQQSHQCVCGDKQHTKKPVRVAI